MSLTPRLFAHAQLDELRVELQRQEQLRHMKRARERLEEQREKVGFYRCLRSSHHTEIRLLEAYARLPPHAHAHVHAHVVRLAACTIQFRALCLDVAAPAAAQRAAAPTSSRTHPACVTPNVAFAAP